MEENVKEIIIKNMLLGSKEQSVTKMVEEQEVLIKEFIELGYKREQFFQFSRELAFVEKRYTQS